MRKKTAIFLITAMLTIVSSFSAFACGGTKENISIDENTLNVKIRSAGYGTTYIQALKEKFEKTFEKEGYKINILTPSADLVSTNLCRDIYSDSGIDLYYTSDITAKDGVAGDFGVIFEDVSDVYKKPAIKFDGTEETETIESKLEVDLYENFVYDGKYYLMPFAYGTSGFAVNKRIYNEYSSELPRTTDEMFAVSEKIMEDALDTAIFPFTYSLSGNFYYTGAVTQWMAQYGGMKEFEQFVSFQKDNGDGTFVDMVDDCYEVFASDSVTKMFEVLFRMYDYNMAALGSGQQDINGAQAQIMKGTAVFYSVGDFFLNEERKRFSKYVDDITFIKAPVISALGVKLFGSGTDYGFDNEKCDKILSEIIKGVDERKTAEEIKAAVDVKFSVSINLADVNTVIERRGYTIAQSSASIVISAKSSKKELAKTFLRFAASREAGELFANEAYTASPWAKDVFIDSDNEYLKSVSQILSNPNATFYTSAAKGYKKAMGLSGIFPAGTREIMVTDIYEKKVTKFDNNDYKIIATNAVYEQAAKEFAQNIYNKSKEAVEKNQWKPLETK